MSAEGCTEYVPADNLAQASRIACDAVRKGAAAVTIADTRGGAARVSVVWPAGHSEWVSWGLCPHCGDGAAVGWREADRFVDAVEFDCPNGCRPGIDEFVRNFPPRQQGWASAS